MPLTEIGVCEYNGFRFNETTKTLGVRVAPVEDSSGRVTSHSEWEIRLQTYIAESNVNSPFVQDAITRLQTHGAAFRFEGRGLGNPNINTGQMKDVAWGPKPGPVQIETHGKQAVKLTWSVTFCIPKCPQGKYEFWFMEFNYTVSHELDDCGFVRRVIAGHLQIPMTRKYPKDQTLPDSVDLYREKIEPPVMDQFRRTYGPFVTSEDRRRLDFSFTDEEMPGDPLPEGVVEATLSETSDSSSKGLRQWNHTVEGTYRLAARTSQRVAVLAFLDFICVKQLPLWKKEFAKEIGQGAEKEAGVIIPTSFSITNPNHYGKPEARLRMSFQAVGSLSRMLAAFDHFKPVPGSDWKRWQTSIRRGTGGAYGSLRLVFDTSAERFGDLCSPLPLLKPNKILSQVAQPKSTGYEALIAQLFKPPEESASWVSYSSAFYLETDDGTAVPALIPDRVLEGKEDVFGRVDSLAGRAWNGIDGGRLPAFPGAGSNGIVGVLSSNETPSATRRTEPQVILYLRGSAVRAGYPIDPPRLLTVNGVKAIPANRRDRGEGFARDVRANFGVPIHRAGWNLRYVLESMPKGALPAPPNPMLGDE
jgi:hypothetical protein